MVAIIISSIIIIIILIDCIRFTSFYFSLKKKGVRISALITRIDYYNRKLKIRSKIPILEIENREVEPFVPMLDLFPYRKGEKLKIIYDPNDFENCIIIDKRSIIMLYLLQSIHLILFSLLFINSLDYTST